MIGTMIMMIGTMIDHMIDHMIGTMIDHMIDHMTDLDPMIGHPVALRQLVVPIATKGHKGAAADHEKAAPVLGHQVAALLLARCKAAPSVPPTYPREAVSLA